MRCVTHARPLRQFRGKRIKPHAGRVPVLALVAPVFVAHKLQLFVERNGGGYGIHTQESTTRALGEVHQLVEGMPHERTPDPAPLVSREPRKTAYLECWDRVGRRKPQPEEQVVFLSERQTDGVREVRDVAENQSIIDGEVRVAERLLGVSQCFGFQEVVEVEVVLLTTAGEIGDNNVGSEGDDLHGRLKTMRRDAKSKDGGQPQSSS